MPFEVSETSHKALEGGTTILITYEICKQLQKTRASAVDSGLLCMLYNDFVKLFEMHAKLLVKIDSSGKSSPSDAQPETGVAEQGLKE